MKLKAKIILGLAIVAGFGITSCKKSGSSAKNGTIVFDTVIYKVQISNPENNNDWEAYTMNNVETSKRKSFLNGLLEEIKAGRTAVYDYKTWMPIAKEKVGDIGAKVEKIVIPSANNPQVMEEKEVKTLVTSQDITSIIFKEVWTLDTLKNKLTKEVIAFCPVVENFEMDSTGMQIYKGDSPLYWIKTKQGTTSNMVTESISYMVGPNNAMDKRVLPLNAKYTTSINSCFIEKAKKDTSNLFNDFNCTEKLAYAQFKDNVLTGSTEQITVKSKSNPDEDSVITHIVKPAMADFDHTFFNESWNYDAKSGVFSKTVNSIGVTESCYFSDPSTGEKILKGFRCVFFSKLK